MLKANLDGKLFIPDKTTTTIPGINTGLEHKHLILIISMKSLHVSGMERAQDQTQA